MTPETFAKWKRTRMDKKQAAEDIQKKAKEAQAAAGKSNGMSGRDLVRSSQKLIIISDSLNQLLFFFTFQFTYNPEWFIDDDDEDDQDEWDIDQYRRETEAEHDAQELARIEKLRVDDDAYREDSGGGVTAGS